jgi:hypothetical protein
MCGGVLEVALSVINFVLVSLIYVTVVVSCYLYNEQGLWTLMDC